MPGEVPVKCATRRDRWIVVLLIALSAMAFGLQDAGAAQAMLSTEVPPSKWKAVRLKNLPKDTSIKIRVESSASISVILVHQEELKRFPAAANPEFQGSTDKNLAFSVQLSRAGDYYVILDNRRNAEARKVRILIRAERKPAEGRPAAPAESGKKKETEI
jgi:hypothetical protein